MIEINKCWYKKGYENQLTEDFIFQGDIFPEKDIITEFINLDARGLLVVKKHYAWDGASGPTIDTPSAIRPSLIHDALYQLMGEKQLPLSFRKAVDDLFRRELQLSGMNSFRAWYWWAAVRWKGGEYAKKPDKEATLAP